ncbi:MAG: hypothetical protein HY473_01970 [Candidatus Sungbacteria bacterium]|uniref:Transcriptional regulator n=1 Tax=Candidatus Sungiibacteriota bacterium TaxID=2750080 RepID=A0A932YWN0_9BACT|nr:hypothetical protein [Candidatus Sungbacteria bacterium]
MDTLENIFGSPIRAKVLKLFLMNPDSQWAAADASRQIRIRSAQFLAEAGRLKRLNILKSMSVRVVVDAPRRRRGPRVVRTRVFAANKDFPLFPELQNLILKSAPHAKGQLAVRIKRLGNVKLAVLAGVFIDNPASRVDLLIVGDGLSKSRMKSFIQWLEAEMGKELNYVAMSSLEFKYRMDMYDRFVRDVLESAHETVVNRLGV